MDRRHHTENRKAALFCSSSRHFLPGSITLKCSFRGRSSHTEERLWDRHTSMKHVHLQNTEKESCKQMVVADATKGGKKNPEEEVICLILLKSALNHQFPGNYSSIDQALFFSWYIESGASSHMRATLFAILALARTSPVSVQMGNMSVAKVDGLGYVQLWIILSGQLVECSLREVFNATSLQ